MKLKAMWCDGLFYPATIVQISEDPKWAKAPVKVNFTGYGDERDVWVGLDKLMNETLPKGTKEVEPKAEAEAEAQELAEHVLGPEGTMAALDVVVSLAMTSKEVARLALRPHTADGRVLTSSLWKAMAEHHNTSPPCRLVFLLDKRELADDEDLALLRSELTEPLELTLVKRPFSEDELENAKELLVALERRAHEVTDDDVESFLREVGDAAKTLTTVNFSHSKVGDAGVQSIARQCLKLTTIHLAFTMVSDAGVQALVQHCWDLTEIHLEATQVSDAGVQALAQHCRELKSIGLQYTQVGDAGVVALAKKCKQIQLIDLFYTQVTDVGVKAISEGCQQLTYINFTGTEVSQQVEDDLKAKGVWVYA